MKTEQKRHYERPRMRVVELQQQPHLLAGSGGGGLDPLSPFNPGSDPLDD